ncbi:VOC family protein [Thalassotalea fusca]
MDNQVVWVDVPVVDLDRAIKFYSAILGEAVTKEQFGDCAFGLLPHAQTNVAGCLAVMEDRKPSANGPLVYFNANGRIDDAVNAAKSFNVEIIEERLEMGEHGVRAVLFDSEGNKIALHSNSK